MKADELASLIEQHFEVGEWFTTTEFRDRSGVKCGWNAVQTLMSQRRIYRAELSQNDHRRTFSSVVWEYAR